MDINKEASGEVGELWFLKNNEPKESFSGKYKFDKDGCLSGLKRRDIQNGEHTKDVHSLRVEDNETNHDNVHVQRV